MNTDPTISVLITVHNREAYLAAAIESVLAQTFQDFEIIIVDDGSTDDSVAVARQFEHDPRVRIYENETNLGDFPNRNKAASYAKGHYLKYVDGDDVVYPHCFEVMLKALEQHPEAGFCLTRGPQAWYFAPVQLSQREAYLEHFFGKGGLLDCGPINSLIKREVFEAIGGFAKHGRCTSDFELWINLARHSPLVLVSRNLFWWRRHPSQESHWMAHTREAVTDVPARLLRITTEVLEDENCPLEPAQVKDAVRYVKQIYVKEGLGWLRRGHPLCAAQFWKVGGLPLRDCRYLWSRPGARPNWPPPPLRGKIPTLPDTLEATARTEQAMVSVCLSTHAPTEHLEAAIQSVREQDFDSWELIILDDGGPDRNALWKRLEPDQRISLIRNETPQGKWAARNQVASAARGTWLKFLDADDLLPHYSLRVSQAMMATTSAALGISIDGVIPPAGNLLSPEASLLQEFKNHPLLQEGVPATFYKRDAFLAAGGFQESTTPACRHLALRLAEQHGCLILPAGLYWVRRNAAPRPRIAAQSEQGQVLGGAWLRSFIQASPVLKDADREAIITGLKGEAITLCIQVLRRNGLGAARAIWQEQQLHRADLKYRRKRKPWVTQAERYAPYRLSHPCPLENFSGLKHAR